VAIFRETRYYSILNHFSRPVVCSFGHLLQRYASIPVNLFNASAPASASAGYGYLTHLHRYYTTKFPVRSAVKLIANFSFSGRRIAVLQGSFLNLLSNAITPSSSLMNVNTI
jgi:hypothetical protein